MAKSRIKDFAHWKGIPGVGGKQGGGDYLQPHLSYLADIFMSQQ